MFQCLSIPPKRFSCRLRLICMQRDKYHRSTGPPKQELLVKWQAPSPGWVRINSDGAARGSPWVAGCGVVMGSGLEGPQRHWGLPMRMWRSFGVPMKACSWPGPKDFARLSLSLIRVPLSDPYGEQTEGSVLGRSLVL